MPDQQAQPSRVWTFVKGHWRSLLWVATIVGGLVLHLYEQRLSTQAIDALNAAHQAEITQVNKARADEEQQHQQELKQLQDAVAQAQADYAQAQQRLLDAQAQEQAQIVKKYGNDPNGLAQLLAGKLGFTVVTR